MRVTLDEASEMLQNGQVVAVPTETVYGLAACLNNSKAVAQIFELKGRPASNPLIIHLPDASAIKKYVMQLPNDFEALAKAFWPGPLTIVLPVDETLIPKKVRAGLPTAAFRVPKHALAQTLMRKTGPLVMPSANLSGRPSATRTEHVESDFGPAFPVLDGEFCERGIESTILYFNQTHNTWQIIRQGALAAEAFEEVLGYTPVVIKNSANQQPICPGQLYRHYAPRARLILGDKAASYGGVVLGYTKRPYSLAKQVLYLGSEKNPESVAENLYAVLRQLDEQNILEAYVDMIIPKEGLWATISERLSKASSKL